MYLCVCETTFCIYFCQTSNGIHNKPNPRPRCVVKANSAVTSTTPQQPLSQMPPPASPPKPAAKPEIVPRSNTSVSGGISNNNQNNNKLVNKTKDDTNEHNAKNLDCVDEGLAMLRRQPSIKDRRKVWSWFHVKLGIIYVLNLTFFISTYFTHWNHLMFYFLAFWGQYWEARK